MNVFQAIKAKVQEQLNALNAEEYRVTLQNDNEAFVFCNRLLKPEEIIAERRLVVLNNKNLVEKLNVYITPISKKYDYYLIDDVLEEELQEIKAQYNICCLIQSSFKNFQVIIKTEHLDIPVKVKSEYFKQLNKQYGDSNIAGYPHAFRLAGFKNVKEKYLDKATGYYPIVNLVFGKNETCKTSKSSILALFNNSEYKTTYQDTNSRYKRFCEVIEANNPSMGELLNVANNFYEAMRKKYGDKTDYSRADFSLLKMLVNSNVDVEVAIDVIKQCSPNLSERHKNIEQYLQITKANLLASAKRS